ncbi:hypothetical protein HD554DRAFT_2277005 [Boletus coccyginus]|nr:hypothetical protein HD554DRAFT_2277005 [Boletus coccyginus]
MPSIWRDRRERVGSGSPLRPVVGRWISHRAVLSARCNIARDHSETGLVAHAFKTRSAGFTVVCKRCSFVIVVTKPDVNVKASTHTRGRKGQSMEACKLGNEEGYLDRSGFLGEVVNVRDAVNIQRKSKGRPGKRQLINEKISEARGSADQMKREVVPSADEGPPSFRYDNYSMPLADLSRAALTYGTERYWTFKFPDGPAPQIRVCQWLVTRVSSSNDFPDSEYVHLGFRCTGGSSLDRKRKTPRPGKRIKSRSSRPFDISLYGLSRSSSLLYLKSCHDYSWRLRGLAIPSGAFQLMSGYEIALATTVALSPAQALSKKHVGLILVGTRTNRLAWSVRQTNVEPPSFVPSPSIEDIPTIRSTDPASSSNGLSTVPRDAGSKGRTYGHHQGVNTTLILVVNMQSPRYLRCARLINILLGKRGFHLQTSQKEIDDILAPPVVMKRVGPGAVPSMFAPSRDPGVPSGGTALWRFRQSDWQTLESLMARQCSKHAPAALSEVIAAHYSSQ